MSRLAEFRRLEEQLAMQLAELEDMKSDQSLQKEIEFEEKLKALMAEYSVNLGSIINLLDPSSQLRSSSTTRPAQRQRKERQVKIYKNPHNGETVETKGGNHKTLKAWKEEYGSEEVESWRAQ